MFASYGMPVPNNQVVEATADVAAALSKLAGDRWVVKAQRVGRALPALYEMHKLVGSAHPTMR